VDIPDLVSQDHSTTWWLLAPAIAATVVIGMLPRVRVAAGPRGGARWRWSVVYQGVGWACIGLGLLGLVLPGPGVLLLIAGVGLVEWRHPLLRRASVRLRRRLRAWARQPGVRGWIGTHGTRRARGLAVQLRQERTRREEKLHPHDG